MPKFTPGPWEFGVREDGSIWLSIGNPKTGPHYQGDIVCSVDKWIDIGMVAGFSAMQIGDKADRG